MEEENPNLKLPKEERKKKFLECFDKLNQFFKNDQEPWMTGQQPTSHFLQDESWSYVKNREEFLEFWKEMPHKIVRDNICVD